MWKCSIQGYVNKVLHVKVFCHFPIILRLQCLFRTPTMSKLMLWHSQNCTLDGFMRHHYNKKSPYTPNDFIAFWVNSLVYWIATSETYPHFVVVHPCNSKFNVTLAWVNKIHYFLDILDNYVHLWYLWYLLWSWKNVSHLIFPIQLYMINYARSGSWNKPPTQICYLSLIG
jgi:hypothetical protein